MNRTALTSVAPQIFRKRLLVEGYYRSIMDEPTLRAYFDALTAGLGLRTYGEPIIHRTSGQGKDTNEGFDAFVPLIDSGIYIAAWVGPRWRASSPSWPRSTLRPSPARRCTWTAVSFAPSCERRRKRYGRPRPGVPRNTPKSCLTCHAVANEP